MGDQLILLETAKLAKEKGCSTECRNYYDENGNLNSTNCQEIIAAPTQSLLQKWLRTSPDLDWPIEMYVKPYLTKSPRKYQCFIWRRGETKELKPELTYEQALEEGLLQSLKLI